MSQPTQSAPLEAFSQWESRSWVEIVGAGKDGEKSSFMPMEKVKHHFTANGAQALNDILSAVFETEHPPIDAELILENHTAVFCILLSIGKGILIEQFAGYEELSDRRLPFDQNNPPPEFRDIEDDSTIFEQFCSVQWRYCVPTFDGHMLNKRFGSQRLLPIIFQERCELGGLAETSVIQVYGPYNEMCSAAVEKGEHVNANAFVLKTYNTKEGQSEYRKEAAAFRSIRTAESVMKFYGSFIHGDNYNIILEYADKGSLEQFYQTEAPPRRGCHIVQFWEALFQVIKSLKVIHGVRGGHHDIRPKAICVLSSVTEPTECWQFKLASFGLDAPRRKVLPGEVNLNEIMDMGTYTAPECCNVYKGESINPKISWEADIWSLGCIYSEAAVWVADGYKGLLDYRKERTAENDRSTFKGSDCFHNGASVLHTVLETHRDIHDRLRRSDHITKEVLESMVEEMLWDEDRPNAQALWRKAEKVLSKANQKLQLQTDQIPRSASRLAHNRLPPRPPIPTQPLPERPVFSLQRMDSIPEQQNPLNVETWRSQVGALQHKPSIVSGVSNLTDSPTLSDRELTRPGSVDDLDRNLAESITSWQQGGDNSQENSQGSHSPNTSYASSPTSHGMEYHRQALADRPRFERKPPPYDAHRKSPSVTSRGFSYTHTPGQSEIGSRPSSPADTQSGSNAEIAAMQHSIDSSVNVSSDLNNIQAATSRSESYAGSRMSQATTWSIPIQNDTHTANSGNVIEDNQTQPALIPERSARRAPMFSLYPSPSSLMDVHPLLRSAVQPPEPSSPPYSPDSFFIDDKSVLLQPSGHTDGLRPSVSTSLPMNPPPPEQAQQFPVTASHTPSSLYSSQPSFSLPESATGTAVYPNQYPVFPTTSSEFLSITSILAWKMQQKTAKKKAEIPPLPGSNLLIQLQERDHVFILSDSSSMINHWAFVKSTFEALSYTVKDNSPDGTELFFTCAYDTYRRKNTADLCKYLEGKRLGKDGECDIAKRLDMQWQEYILRLRGEKVWAGPAANKRRDGKDGVRPMSWRLFTDGEWIAGSGEKLKTLLTDIANTLKEMDAAPGQVSISIVSFAETEEAQRRIDEIANSTYAIDIITATNHTGNALNMLLGPLNRNLDASLSATSSTTTISGHRNSHSSHGSIYGGLHSRSDSKASSKASGMVRGMSLWRRGNSSNSVKPESFISELEG